MKLLAVVLGVGAAMTPCLWDSDTLDTELRGLPDALDLVAGRWHRHSDAYYADRVARLANKDPLSFAECDDLAVAYEHGRDRSMAVAVMAKKAAMLAATPNKEHQYRYHANLGTFYAHEGKFDDALRELRAAIAVNPEAHFGREVFQVELIEYVAAARKDPELWKRFSFLRHAGYKLRAFLAADGLRYAPSSTRNWDEDWRGTRELDWDKAYKAVAGMLRFGGLEGPELYRALAELFLVKRHLNLAWWALERAIERGHPAASLLRAGQAGIAKHWDESRSHYPKTPRPPSRQQVQEQRDAADRWVAAFQAAEAAAIKRGQDVRSDAALRRLLDAANAEAGAARVGGGAVASGGVLWALPLFGGMLLIWLLLRSARGR
ncbi:MAG: hypothetical protein VYA51_04605 [Planctomycetota bacterium]|nr:hypothetical protein [Planctomycetota bacterium]MEC9047272.1 hypothetical protein [Planctomycetota bacterium]